MNHTEPHTGVVSNMQQSLHQNNDCEGSYLTPVHARTHTLTHARTQSQSHTRTHARTHADTHLFLLYR